MSTKKKKTKTLEELKKDAIIKMTRGPVSLEDLKLSVQDIADLKKEGFNIKHIEEMDAYAIEQSSGNNFLIKSLKTKKNVTEKWLELSDIRIGNKYFDEAALRYVLNKAQEEGYLDVYIAGDITTGHPMYAKQEKWKYINEKYFTSKKQAKYAISIFKDYPKLNYYVINGRRDKSFEKYGEKNPILYIKDALEKEGINFCHIDDYCCNILINGCVKRFVYLDRKTRTYTKSYPIDIYLREQLENIGTSIIHNNVGYKIRALQVGNVVFDSYDIRADIYITTSGGFIFDSSNILRESTAIPSGTLCTVNFKDGDITSFNAKIVRYPKDIEKV